jgi:glucose-6-phosphate 1-dehydrogenase
MTLGSSFNATVITCIDRLTTGDARHYAFCNMMLQGFNMLSIARIGGHKTLRMQMHYHAHLEHFAVFRFIKAYDSSDEVHRHVVRGQYKQGKIKGEPVKSYREEPSVDPQSKTETYFAAKVFVDNFRWAGVPFYVRTGKRLPVKTTEVVVEFKNMPENVYFAQKNKLEPNLLVFRVNPMEGIYFKINAKNPGSEWSIMSVAMDFCQNCQIGLNTRKPMKDYCTTRSGETPPSLHDGKKWL